MNMLLVETKRDPSDKVIAVELDQTGMGHETSTPDAVLLTRRIAMIDRTVEICRYAPEPDKVPDLHTQAMESRVVRLEFAKEGLLEKLGGAVRQRVAVDPDPIAA